jgi:hypothetical protein
MHVSSERHPAVHHLPGVVYFAVFQFLYCPYKPELQELTKC